MLTNLIKNAVEAIEGAGLEAIKDPVIIVSRRGWKGERVRIDVSDNGKGWPKENRQRLLEPYMTTREKGTGLGLAIVAKIIEQHGGTVELIDAEPDANGRVGACFTFTLPTHRDDADDEPDEVAVTELSGAPASNDPSQAGEAAPRDDIPEEPPVKAVENT